MSMDMIDQKSAIAEGVLIAAITATGYWLAFLYELGYCKYFNIPIEFIEIGILNILVAVIGVFGILAMLNMYINPLHLFVSKLPRPLKFAIYRTSIPIVFIASYGAIVRLPTSQWWLLFGLFVAPLVFFEFVFPLITQRKTKGYIAKLEAQDKIENDHDTLLDMTAKSIGRDKFLIILFFFLLSVIAFFSGGFDAKSKHSFVVIKSDQELVSLKTRGDFFLAASFDRKEKIVNAEYTLIPISPQAGQIKYEKIGPLVPRDPK